MAIPTKDSALAEYSTNFNTLGTASPVTYSLTAPQMLQFTTLQTAWMSAYNAAKADGSRSKALVQAKNTAKANLLTYARELYTLIQGSLTVTDANKVLIGVAIRKTIPTPMPPPAMAPKLTLISVIGRVARYQLGDLAFPNSKRRPPNAEGATIMSFTGATPPPSNDPGWKLEGQTGKMQFSVQFSNDVTPGEACWVTCLWYSRRGDYSPAADPVQTYLQIGPALQQAA